MFDLFHGLDLWVGLSLVLALTFVLAFEFINGFHDTANAVATVIYKGHAAPGGGAVGDLQFSRRAAGRRGRGLCHRPPAAGRAADQRGYRTRPGHGVRHAGRRHRLEPGYLVLRHPRLQLAHADRLHPGRGPGQCADHRPATGRRRQLGQGHRYRPVAGGLAGGGLPDRGRPAAGAQALATAVEDAQDARATARTGQQEAPAVLEPPGAGAVGDGRELRARLERWPEGHWPDHAGADRHRARQFRAGHQQHHLPDRAHPRRRHAP